MNEYVQIEFPFLLPEQKDILIAKLILAGAEGFEETATGLKGFIRQQDFDENVIKEISGQSGSPYHKTIIDETNWNHVWESNFDPVIVGDFVAIRADFHDPVKSVMHELIVTPKMSFGTGHHATTFMMIQQMQQVDFSNKVVLDFGTGTGVLAILAEKLGAAKVIAIDNDDWSISNASENIFTNNCRAVELIKADQPPATVRFDIILANINKNVILDNFGAIAVSLAPKGVLLISGLLAEDQDVVFRKSVEYSLHLIQTSVRDNWLCLRLSC